MTEKTWTIERVAADDLPEINQVIGRAISAWTVSDRVKRLALPLYHYNLSDLEDLHIVKVTGRDGAILGVVAWAPAGPEDTLGKESEALLHGIYINPAHQGLGIGKGLFEHTRQLAEKCGYRGFIVKASKDAAGFFEHLGLERVECDSTRYPYLFWKAF